jgi:hypothetical protein
MTTRTRVPLALVWAAAVTVFVGSVLVSRALLDRPTPWPAYWAGLVGLLAIGAALLLSWRGLGEPGAHSTATRRALRGIVAAGAFIWFVAMVFPFL